jgi:Holliday junction resolvase RusA-like endonuclease
VKLTILGRPITKSNSQRIGRSRSGKPFVMPSKAAAAWEEHAILQLQAQHGRASRACGVLMQFMGGPGHPCAINVNAKALIYRPINGPGDASNYYKAVGDALERAGIVANDRLIRSWNGSDMLIDRRNPRVEIELTPIAHTEATG